MARPRSRSRVARQVRAPKPPLQAANTYARALGSWLDAFDSWALDRIISTWSENTATEHPKIRADAKFEFQIEAISNGGNIPIINVPLGPDWTIVGRSQSEASARKQIQKLQGFSEKVNSSLLKQGKPTIPEVQYRVKPLQVGADIGVRSIYTMVAPPVVPPPLGDWIHQRVGEMQVALTERFAPETSLSRTLGVVAARVDKKGKLEFQRVVGVPTKSIVSSGAVESWRTKNIGLIKSLAGKQIEEIRDVLTSAQDNALRVEDLRAKIQERFDVTKSKADLLARDQTLKLNGQITQERQQASGITHYVWTTSNDERVRPAHEKLDGTTQSWISPPEVSEDGRHEHPGGDYQCRCTADPILDGL